MTAVELTEIYQYILIRRKEDNQDNKCELKTYELTVNRNLSCETEYQMSWQNLCMQHAKKSLLRFLIVEHFAKKPYCCFDMLVLRKKTSKQR